ILIPYNIALPASMTSLVSLSGNLSSDAELSTSQTQKITSTLAYTVSGEYASLDTAIDELDQFSGGSGTGGKLNLGTGESGKITITGYQPDGTAINSTFTVGTDGEATPGCVTLGDFIDHLNTVLDGATASLSDGTLQIKDDASGYSMTDIELSYSANGSSGSDLTDPAYFEVLVVGGSEVKSTNITIYDSLGGDHSLNASFVRNDTDDTWDMLITSISGNVQELGVDERRITGISFDADGSFKSCSDDAKFSVTFEHDTSSAQTIELSMGSPGELDGLTGFSGSSTAVAEDQDGYEAGTLSSVSISTGGVIVGSFTNNIKRDIGTVQIALFQNASGLESVGGGYYTTSANSGEAIATQGLTGGAGSIHGSSLEKSNADVATEFVNLIQAQNGYQANARTITVANEILQELTNLIR
ncbi:MAG TPA: flagellar hook-basal body complex protein, partial [Sedimentisphaerales bacterium]|nr:flagellar hook-basal body complex protein [Sedimentisphaerales bacterium]